MSEYHVGCGLAGIYAGTLKPNGHEWRNKSNVTIEALDAAAQYLYERHKEVRFEKGGKRYTMCVIELRGDEDEAD